MVSFLLIFFTWYDIGCLKSIIPLYGFEMIIFLYPVQQLILFLFKPVCVSYHLNYCSTYNIGCLTRTDHFFGCKIIIIIYSVHWMILYLLRYECCFFLLSIIVAGYFDLYFVTIYWFIVAGMVLAYVQSVITLYIFLKIIII